MGGVVLSVFVLNSVIEVSLMDVTEIHTHRHTHTLQSTPLHKMQCGMFLKKEEKKKESQT